MDIFTWRFASPGPGQHYQVTLTRNEEETGIHILQPGYGELHLTSETVRQLLYAVTDIRANLDADLQNHGVRVYHWIDDLYHAVWVDTDNRGQWVVDQRYFWRKCVVRQFSPSAAEYFSVMDLADVSIRESYGRVSMLNISAQAHQWAGIPDLNPGTVLDVLAWCAREADQLDLAIRDNEYVDMEAYGIMVGLKPDRPRDSSEAALSAVDWDKTW